MLQEFYSKLKKEYEGSLIRTKTAMAFDRNAKEYLNRLAKEGLVERVTWGWYHIPRSENDVWEFIRRDKNFKVVVGQSAASFWNKDFVHRDICTILVNDKSYGNALENLARARKWNVDIIYSKDLLEYEKVGNIYLERLDQNIIDCIGRWAFLDAFATIYEQRRKINLKKFMEKNYWKRIPNSNARMGPIIAYGFRRFNEAGSKKMFPEINGTLRDDFLRRTIDEAVERVIEFA